MMKLDVIATLDIPVRTPNVTRSLDRPNALRSRFISRDHLGNRAGNAAVVTFARGFEDELVKRAAEAGVTLVSAADLFTPLRSRLPAP
jgi:hypothetical protein